MSNAPRFRYFIIGAGFSVHAGLPMGEQLFDLVRKAISFRDGADNHLERDLNSYLEYRHRCDGTPVDRTVDYEKFMSHLDLEHYLGLRGSDTWSEEGNESQLLIRRGIQEVIFERTPKSPTEECRKFCKQLLPKDVVLTFNYDTLIEDTLDSLGKPYRLFPNRLKEVGLTSSTIDSDAEDKEILICKLHGSIDWYDKTPYLRDREHASQVEYPWSSRHPVFKEDSAVSSTPLLDGACEDEEPLKYIYRVADLSQLAGSKFWQCTPLILSPSSSKILYANPIKSLWSGLQQAGGLNFGIGVVGYSLPAYDEYARQALYHLLRNYTEYEYDLEMMGLTKGPIRIVDYSPPGDPGWRIRKNYSFVNWDRCELNTTGLTMESIDWIMQ